MFKGTVTRGGYWATWAIAIAVYVTTVAVAGLFYDSTQGGGGSGTAILGIVGFVVYTWIVFGGVVARLKDAGYSGWAALLLLVPGANVIIIFGLGIQKHR